MSDKKLFKRKDIVERNTAQDAVFVINNLVYDVTNFLDDHPGGHEVMLNVAGKDASEDFEDVGHSSDAKEMMKKYVIGEIVDEEKTEVKKRSGNWQNVSYDSKSNFWSSWKFPVALGLLITVIYTYLFV